MGFSNGYDSGYDDGFADGVKSVQQSSGGRQPSPAISSSGGPSGPQQAAPVVPSVDFVINSGYSNILVDSDGFLHLSNGDRRDSFIIASPNGEMSRAILAGANLGSVAKVELLSGTADVVIPSDFWKVIEAGMISLNLGVWWDSYKAQLYIADEAVYDKTKTGLDVRGDFDEIYGDIRVTLESGATCMATGFRLATEEP